MQKAPIKATTTRLAAAGCLKKKRRLENMAGGNLSDSISNLTDFQNTVGCHRRCCTHSNFPS